MRIVLFVILISIGLFANAQKLKFKEGKKVADFSLSTNAGRTFTLSQTLDSGKQVLLIFYQGTWNEYDIKYLKKIATISQELKTKNVEVVLVTREKHGYSKKLKEMGIPFSVYKDADWLIMSQYGVAYKMSKGNLPSKYKEYSKKNSTHTGFTDDIVPIPATFVIGSDQKVKFVHYDYDYRQHPPISEILNSL
jgi:peroxiredoxin